jgi:hypothetical protein
MALACPCPAALRGCSLVRRPCDSAKGLQRFLTRDTDQPKGHQSSPCPPSQFVPCRPPAAGGPSSPSAPPGLARTAATGTGDAAIPLGAQWEETAPSRRHTKFAWVQSRDQVVRGDEASPRSVRHHHHYLHLVKDPSTPLAINYRRLHPDVRSTREAYAV